MENIKNLSAGSKICFYILAILTAVGTIAEVYMTLVGYFSPQTFIQMVVYLFLLALIIYYVFNAYKKPHGDLLRYLFVLISFNCLTIILDEIESMYHYNLSLNYMRWFVGLIGIAAILSAYISGRLDKINRNVLPIVIITLALFAKNFFYFTFPDFYAPYGLIEIIWYFATFILWLDIVFAYVLRYREHKEAGLEEDKK